MEFDTKIQINDAVLPVPAPSTTGHVQSFGGEMLTWAREGALTGLAIGLLAGIGLYLMVMAGFIVIPSFEILRSGAPILFAAIILLLSAGIGAAGGTVVGIGTPRFNPHPSQGWVSSWKTFILRRKNHDKYIYVPEFKNVDAEAHRRSQRT